MPLLDHWIRLLATLIEFGGGLLVVFGCGRGLLRLVAEFGSRDSIVAARLCVGPPPAQPATTKPESSWDGSAVPSASSAARPG